MARLSLRWRVAIAFGLSFLLVASLFTVATWSSLPATCLANASRARTSRRSRST
jgi:hypothetical protein